MSEIGAPDSAQEHPIDTGDTGGTEDGSSGGAVRSFVSSPAGRKIVPVASIGLILLGAVLVIVGLTEGFGDPEQVVVSEPAAPGQLLAAMEIAKAALVDEKPNSYLRFTPEDAARAPKGVEWALGGTAVAGKIVIHTPGRTSIVLVAKDASTGQVYCIADTDADDAVTKGAVDATTPDGCTGGWPQT